ncbi:acyl carrier protein [Actinophytocola algeriensis]|jgi:acyl carrier protein|uniref:Acyl carrier protein n=1 Tax=Actinophytocola algeriensis TaxID=1768010 RepID=A0A7W7Q9M8_9PSEU|nr:acyl carrier protein [Actinophytocola algeriensis]MBB4909176.1 acyl carrier protein [Actinophytocola algeriensis]MBE1474436.1 acyl carrier protein [Actinophytocola algeriensis]
MSTVDELTRGTVVDAVRALLVADSRQPIDPDTLAENEPLNGGRLRLTSVDAVWLLVRLEADLAVRLPDDIVVGRRFRTVGDFVDAVLAGTHAR